MSPLPRLAAVAVFLLPLTPACTTGQSAVADRPPHVASGAVQLIVLYPQPTDVEQFEADYRAHLRLLHEAMGFSADGDLPYTVTRFRPTADGPGPYYQQFTWTLPSAEALAAARARSGMQEVAADAVRISSGGPPVVLVGDVR